MSITPGVAPGYTPNMFNNPGIGDYIRNLERRIARLERSTNGLDSDPTPVFVASLNITGLALQAQTVTPDQDGYKVFLRFGWNAVTTDPNAINKDEPDVYLVSASTDGVNFTAETPTTGTSATIGPVPQGLSITFRVRVRTKKGVYGNYSSLTVTSTSDNVAPGQPSTPTMQPYLGQLKIHWDGLSSLATAMPADFVYAEVHLSTSSATFTPSATTLIGTILRGGGDWIATDLTYGTTYWTRLVAVDSVGNRSSTSVAASAVPEQIVNGDLGANSVATANIQNLAVNNAKIADLSVGKLTAGTLSVNVTVSGRFATALSGARVEINSAGLQAFNPAGNKTLDVASATGNAVLVGTFRTAFSGSGQPHTVMQDSGDRTTMYWYDATELNPAFMNTPADPDGVPRWGVNGGQFNYFANTIPSRQRVFLNNKFGLAMETIRTSNNLAIGGRLALTDSGSQFDHRLNSGTQTGGAVYVDQSVFVIARNGSGSPNGGSITGELDHLWLEVYTTGNIAARVKMDSSGLWQWIDSKFDNFVDLGTEQGVMTGNVGASAGTSWAISYGTTKSGGGMLPIVTPLFNAAVGWAVTASSASGFTVSSTNTVAGSIRFWAYRI
jgi:hypothetical protein